MWGTTGRFIDLSIEFFTIIPILAPEALLCENKIFQYQNVIPSDDYFLVKLRVNTETLGSLFNHALHILPKSPKSKNQVVHEEKFKDSLTSTCQVRVSDLELPMLCVCKKTQLLGKRV